MRGQLLRIGLLLRSASSPLIEATVGLLAVGLLRAMRGFDPDKTANFFGKAARAIAPMMRENAIGRANLTAAFPEKSPQEIETILAGVWDNLGRVAAEYANLDKIWQHDRSNPSTNRVEIEPRSAELFNRLRDDGKPALIFAAHLGNWELPAVAAAEYGLDTAVLFRPPNIEAVNRAVQKMRAIKMGEMIPARPDAPYRLGQALLGGRHVAMLIDQYFTKGVYVTFFGRPTKVNPALARLLRQVDCPIHGVRIIRLPGHRFRAELSEEIAPVRDASGQVDIQGTMQAVTSVLEAWIREYPDQWLWLHRRWRNY